MAKKCLHSYVPGSSSFRREFLYTTRRVQFFTPQEFKKAIPTGLDKEQMKAEICCNYIFSRRTGNKTGIRKQRKRLEKVEWYKICMRIGAETIFKEVLPSVCFLVYVLFYLVKGPVGTNKGKKMEHFRLETKHANFLSFSFSRSIISLDRWVQSQLMVTFVCTKSLTHL